MKIGFAKIGRAWDPRMDHASTVGGDIDVIRSLDRLRRARPDDHFILLGKTRTDPRDVFGTRRLTAPWYEDPVMNLLKRAPAEAQMNAITPYAASCDAMVIWLGQIGGAATPLPKLDGSGPIQPLEMDINYAAYICRAVNIWRELYPERDVIWLVPDARNRLALHDFRDPPTEPLLAQYDTTRNGVHYAPTAEDPNRFIRAIHRFIYGAVELCAIPDLDEILPPYALRPFEDRVPFGVVANENKRGKYNRAALLKEWVGDLSDVPVYGKWSAEGMAEMGIGAVENLPYSELYNEAQCWKATITLPASGSGWATAKPWEMFATGTVCFFHPGYDDQGHIVAVDPAKARTQEEAFLSVMLRPKTPDEFQRYLRSVSTDPKLYGAIVKAQQQHLARRFAEEGGGIRMVMERLRQYE